MARKSVVLPVPTSPASSTWPRHSAEMSSRRMVRACPRTTPFSAASASRNRACQSEILLSMIRPECNAARGLETRAASPARLFDGRSLGLVVAVDLLDVIFARPCLFRLPYPPFVAGIHDGQRLALLGQLGRVVLRVVFRAFDLCRIVGLRLPAIAGGLAIGAVIAQRRSAERQRGNGQG